MVREVASSDRIADSTISLSAKDEILVQDDDRYFYFLPGFVIWAGLYGLIWLSAVLWVRWRERKQRRLASLKR